jgi:serine/threonine-protein kinase
MTHDSTDSNLLFGVLALQADLLDANRFAEACSAWAGRKDTCLADLLVERGWITTQDKLAVERLVQLKLQKHAGNLQASLAAVAGPDVQRVLADLDDADIQHSLAGLPQRGSHLLVETVAYEPRGRDRYTLTRLQARGGMGEVWLAHDTDLGRDVALKELRVERTDEPEVWARFVEEAKITGRLEHPGIVPVYELVRPGDRGRPFYTMRFVRGRTFTDVIKSYHQKRVAGSAGPFDQRELLNAFVGVCNAVAYAHARGVLHRDLKGQNVVLGDFGEVMVLDWGLAKVVQDRPAEATRCGIVSDHATTGVPKPVMRQDSLSHAQTLQGQVLGTPGYMAPEQADGRLEQITERTDVYGLGAILYEVLTGQPPFTGTETHEVLKRVINERPLRPREVVTTVPRPLEAICLQALAKDPKERYASARALADEVRHWLADEPVTAYRDSVPARVGRWSRRHKPLVAASVTLLLAAVAALAVTTAVVHRQQQQTKEQRDLALAERDRADREQQEAERQKQRALAERDRADQNFALIQKALEETTTKIVDNRRLKEADFHDLRKELLAASVPFYQKLTAQKGGDPKLEAARGQTYLRLAKVRGEMGRIDEALADLQKAEQIFRQLLADDTAVPEYRQGLAESRKATASWMIDRGKMKEAEQACREAIPLWGKLAADAPKVAEHRLGLARCHELLGSIVGNLGRQAEAEAEYRAALKIQTQLVQDFKKSPEYRAGLASIHHNLGVHFYHAANSQSAEEEYRSALRIRQELVDEFPAEFEYRQRQAQEHSSLATQLSRVGKVPAALAEFEKALAIQEKLVTEFPALPSCRQDLAQTCNNMSLRVTDPSRQEALAERSLVLKEKLVADFPKIPGFRDDLARGYMNRAHRLMDLGRWQEAEAELRKTRAIQEKLVAEFHDVVQYAVYQGIGFAATGDFYFRQGQLANALPWHDKAAAALETAIARNWSQSIARYSLYDAHLKRAASLHALKRYPDSLKAVDVLINGSEVPADVLGRGAALCSVVTAAPESAQFAEEYAARGVKLWTKLKEQGKLKDSRPLADAYHNLGTALSRKQKLDEAIAAYHKAIILQKDFALAYFNLGDLLQMKGQLDDAIANYKEAIRVKQNYPEAYNHLGLALHNLEQHEKAIAAYRKAIELKPDYADAHYNLGNALKATKALDEAITAFRKAIELKKDYAEAHCNLGHALREKGQLAEAVEALRRGDELGSKRPGWHYPSKVWLRTAERMAELDPKLPAILAGEVQPANDADRLILADLCRQPFKRFYVASARFSQELFTGRPELTENPASNLRYNAACAAALAGCGQGHDAGKLDDKERARWRAQARDWLSADLAAWTKLAGEAKEHARIRQTLQHWQTDTDLASLRDQKELAKLPSSEQEECKKLWTQVSALLRRVQEKPNLKAEQ